MPSTTIKATFGKWPIQTWVGFLLAATVFVIPLSSTAKSIFVILSFSMIVLTPQYHQIIFNQVKKMWCWAAVAVFLIALIASVWSPAGLHEKMVAIEKYSKLLYLPVFAAGFTDPNARRLGLHAFLLAMFLTCIVSLLWLIGLLNLPEVEGGGIFRNHIMTGFMMAFAAYLSSFLLIQSYSHSRRIGTIQIIYFFLTLLFTYHVFFINNGRTGYVIYFMLMVLLMLQTFSWRQAVLGIVLGCSLLGISYYQSPVMQEAIQKAVNDCQMYKENKKDTNIGYRLQFHDYAYLLFKRSPWFGNGTASFADTFHKENPIPSRGDRLLEPHSQYWLVASEFGLLGCFALVGFFASLLIASFQLKTLKPLALAILLPFIVGNLSDSLLFYSGTGYFFILFMALCLGEQDDV